MKIQTSGLYGSITRELDGLIAEGALRFEGEKKSKGETTLVFSYPQDQFVINKETPTEGAIGRAMALHIIGAFNDVNGINFLERKPGNSTLSQMRKSSDFTPGKDYRAYLTPFDLAIEGH